MVTKKTFSFKEVGIYRLASQHITDRKLKSAKAVVSHMGAMQAQDHAMVKWAVGIRFASATETTINNAMESGKIIRTHLLRPTWHLVAATDVYWMLELTAPQIKATMKSRLKALELTEKSIAKSNTLIEKALTGGQQLTREALNTVLKKAKYTLTDNRLAHMLCCAELEGIICNGISQDKKQTYALLAERVPKPKVALTREEALAKLAKKYFQSHSPATLQDFIWWSGLSVKDAKNGLEQVKGELLSETINSDTYWFNAALNWGEQIEPAAYLLPAFDEFIIGYKNRSSSLSAENYTKVITNNGLFRPVIVINGQVTGLWKRVIKNDTVIIEADLFQTISKSANELIERAAIDYGRFLNKKTEVVFNSTTDN